MFKIKNVNLVYDIILRQLRTISKPPATVIGVTYDEIVAAFAAKKNIDASLTSPEGLRIEGYVNTEFEPRNLVDEVYGDVILFIINTNVIVRGEFEQTMAVVSGDNYCCCWVARGTDDTLIARIFLIQENS